MAANQVFNVGELVEMILIELPIKDLLLSQRINRKCKQTVESSTPIKKALFMVPGDANDTNVPVKGNAFDSPDSWKFDASTARLYYIAPWSKIVADSGLAYNPLLIDSVFRSPRTNFIWRSSYRRFDFELLKTHKDASWRRMFISQPPLKFTTRELLRTEFRGTRANYMWWCRTQLSDGITFGDLAKGVQKWLKYMPRVNFEGTGEVYISIRPCPPTCIVRSSVPSILDCQSWGPA